jgi:hypothetical protein
VHLSSLGEIDRGVLREGSLVVLCGVLGMGDGTPPSVASKINMIVLAISFVLTLPPYGQ